MYITSMPECLLQIAATKIVNNKMWLTAAQKRNSNNVFGLNTPKALIKKYPQIIELTTQSGMGGGLTGPALIPSIIFA